MTDPAWQERVGGNGYPLGQCQFFLALVLAAGVPLRAASRVLELVGQLLGLDWEVPDWTTGRLWLLRLGHAMLSRPKEVAEDWVWLIDFSIQIGEQKVLIIVGMRLSQLPPLGECLRHTDLEPIAVVPLLETTKAAVDAELEAATATTGVPVAIVEDHGGDVAGGVALFQERHPQTKDVYDIKHKAACLLKRRLESDSRWPEFSHQVGQTKFATQQTELAFLVPPSQRSKARFMNLEPLVRWARQTLAIIDQPPACVLEQVDLERLEEKFGWLTVYREALAEWSEWLEVIETAVDFVRRQGLYRGAESVLAQQLGLRPTGDAVAEGVDGGAMASVPGGVVLLHASSQELAEELRSFVAAEASKAPVGQRLPGTTEVLESCFGKFKALEKDHAKGGFTSLLLSFGALMADVTLETVGRAFDISGVKDVWDWCREHLGTTVQGQRRLAYCQAARATKPG